MPNPDHRYLYKYFILKEIINYVKSNKTTYFSHIKKFLQYAQNIISSDLSKKICKNIIKFH